MLEPRKAITAGKFDAVLFDLDGVLTATAKVHAACWKRTFDEFLERRAAATGGPFKPFEIETDYKIYVDGKPRFEGVKSFLESRGIELPWGDPRDPPGDQTVCAVGNRKNEMINEVLASEGVETLPGSAALVRHLRRAGIKTAVVSSSANCRAVLAAAQMTDLFDARVDGEVAAELQLPGKPAPDTFLEAARQLGATPGRTVVVEDAISGVKAGRAGGFGLVVGVGSNAEAAALRQNGADLVVSDLSELLP